jgi:hypothetical protein
MKSIKHTISLFLILSLISYCCSTATNSQSGIKSTVQLMTSVEQNVYEGIWKNLFNQPRTVSCRKTNLLNRIRRELIEDGTYPGSSHRKGKKFAWVRQWGYGPAAYFFDYLDTVLRADAVKEFKDLYDSGKKFPQTDSKIKDSFDYKKLVQKGTAKLPASVRKILQRFTKHYDPDVYDKSLNLPQFQAAITKWKWPTSAGDPSFFKRFIVDYDMNYDGRLSPREFVLLSIHGNTNVLGTELCEHCYTKVSKKIDAIFMYLDCDNNGLLSAEEMWNNLSKLKRKSETFNIYQFGLDESIRTSAINDFILKNWKTKDGFLTRSEFRRGVLLGFWDRQTENTKIFEKGERALTSLRWHEQDMIDFSLYNYYKRKMRAGLIK